MTSPAQQQRFVKSNQRLARIDAKPDGFLSVLAAQAFGRIPRRLRTLQS